MPNQEAYQLGHSVQQFGWAEMAWGGPCEHSKLSTPIAVTMLSQVMVLEPKGDATYAKTYEQVLPLGYHLQNSLET